MIRQNVNKTLKFCLIPVIILLIGAVTYFIIIPHIYGRVLSFGNDMFANTETVIDMIQNPGVAFLKTDGDIGIRLFWYVWWVVFIASLFFVGKKLHMKPAPDNPNAILVKREPYLMIQDVSENLKCINSRKSEKLDELLYEVKCLEEKLSIESDFGYGSDIIINCENNIAMQLQFLIDTVSNIDAENFNENIKKASAVVTDINSLLRRRGELKKVNDNVREN